MLIREFVEAGTPLRLELESDNPASNDAIAVWMDAPNGRAIHLGYLGGEIADQVADLILQGAEMSAEVTAVTGGTFDKPTHGVNIAISYEMPEESTEARPRPDAKSTLKAILIVLAIVAVLCGACLIIAYLSQDPESARRALETFPV
jgi:hypothetical protein